MQLCVDSRFYGADLIPFLINAMLGRAGADDFDGAGAGFLTAARLAHVDYGRGDPGAPLKPPADSRQAAE